MATTTLGLDIGSRTVKAVWIEGDQIRDWAVTDAGFDPQAAARSFLDRATHDRVVATGYGRHAVRNEVDCRVVTEIKAYAIGSSHLFPDAASVLDIGGQDTKVVSLDREGAIIDFQMNDKCSAGTGKFLEVMARALGFSLGEMADAALASDSPVAISSMCTVFAESEVTGLIHRGRDRGDIARGLHESIAGRTLGALKRIGAEGPLVFAGGVALNRAMVALVTDAFVGDVLVPDEARIVGALGAALSGT